METCLVRRAIDLRKSSLLLFGIFFLVSACVRPSSPESCYRRHVLAGRKRPEKYLRGGALPI